MTNREREGPGWTTRFKLRQCRKPAVDHKQRRMLLGHAAAVFGLAPVAAHATTQRPSHTDSKAEPAKQGLTEHQRTYYRLARF